MKTTMIGVDLAKSVLQLHGASMKGDLYFRKKLSRCTGFGRRASGARCGAVTCW